MAKIIEFPKPQGVADDDIPEVSRRAARELFRYLDGQHVRTRDLDFLRDLAIIRRFIEAAMLRQTGVMNTYVRLLDDIFDKIPPSA